MFHPGLKGRAQTVVAAGIGATPAAFYLGLCRLRGILSLPAAHDYAAGGPFFCAATMALHRFASLGLKSVSVSAITCPRYKKSRVCALLFFSPFVWEEVPVCFGFGSRRHGGRSVEYIRQVVEEVDAHLTA